MSSSAPAARPGDRLLVGTAAVLLGLSALTFVAPLDEDAARRVADGITLLLGLGFLAGMALAVRRSRGLDRQVWSTVLASRLVVVALLVGGAREPLTSPIDEGMPTAIAIGPLTAFIGLVALLVVCRRVLQRSNVVSFVLDSTWLALAALALIWPWVGEPAVNSSISGVGASLLVTHAVLAAATGGVFGALLLRAPIGVHLPLVMIGLGFVALRIANVVYYRGWLEGGIAADDPASFAFPFAYATAMVAALSAPRLAPRLDATEPSPMAVLAATWMPVAMLGGVFAVERFEVDVYWFAVIGICIVSLLVRVSVEQVRNLRLATDLHRLATRDPLTSLPNRRSLERRLGDHPTDLTAVMLIDLDRFKSVNDQLGHDVGDQLLQEVADRLGTVFDADDWLLARIGGDEFVAVSSTVGDRTQVEVLARRAIDVVSNPFSIRGREAWVGASVGVATLHDGIRADELHAVADLALRQAKAAGRGEVVLSNDGLRRRAGSATELSLDITAALERDEFFCLYQPKVDLVSGEMAGVEALIRWDHPERGVLAPGDFLDVAESTGLIARIDDVMLRKAVTQLGHWNREFARRLRLSANMSAWQLARQDVASDIARTLAIVGWSVDPGQVTIELTETLLIDDPLIVRRRLDRLCSTGIAVSVDDFGAGFTSIAHLRQFPISEVKIDRSLIMELEEGSDGSGSVVSAVIALAQALGLRVVAEGVETHGQATALRTLGCRTAQGFLFAHPLPAEEIDELLRTPRPFAAMLRADPGLPTAP